jgi:hypothetical protein
MSFSGSRPQRLKEMLGLSSDLLGVIGAVIVLGPPLVAIVTGSLLAAVSVLAACLGIAVVFLILRLRRANREMRVLRYDYESAKQVIFVAAEALETVDPRAVPAGPEMNFKASPSEWLRDRNELHTFSMTRAEFTRCAERATELAAVQVKGDDLVPTLIAVLLRLPAEAPERFAMPVVQFGVLSQTARKHLSVKFRGSISQYKAEAYRAAPENLELLSLESEPWLKDDGWLPLVGSSWTRMRPFEGGVVLYHVPAREARPYGLWRVSYMATVGGHGAAGTPMTQTFALRRGVLEEVIEARR